MADTVTLTDLQSGPVGSETMMNVSTMENRIKRLESFFGTNNATVRALRAQVWAEKLTASRVDKRPLNSLKTVSGRIC